jgi:predicted Ser/Thr protein kinase
MRGEMDELRPPHAGAPVADELRGARPASDAVGMEAARARAERALFGDAAPARLGRYVVLERIAGGGMGVVYRGYDPELHRKVALKVLHPRAQEDDRAHARLLAEARALARLDHHNVVRIHDVLAEAGQVVLVMELAEGETLAAWERGAKRSWREIVAAYAQAGRGLVAAHELGIVHRDFKPANAVIGVDGRVRVLDFGLALGRGVPEAAPLAVGSPDHREPTAEGLTATGEVVGTLGYTSPEQLAGQVATPASDQYSLCVALHRALESCPPFAGSDPVALEASIRAGRIDRATDGRAIPAWLRAAIARGLAADPAQRHASVAALLAVLTRARGWRRWRTPVVVVAVGAAIAGAAMRPRAAAGPPPCDGGLAEIDPVWNAAQRETVTTALRTAGTPAADGTDPRVLAGLDRYRTRWIDLHRDACQAHRRGEQSADLLDRRMLCLGRRRADLAASVDVLANADRATAGHAIDVVVGLPPVDDCADLASLTADVAPPATPAQRTRVGAVRATLGQAAALDRGGHTEQALTVATAAQAEARQVGYGPLEAEAALARGTLLLSMQRNVDAAPVLAEARTIALRERMVPLAVEAAARKLFVEQMEHADPSALERDIAIFEPMSRGIIGDHIARPLLLNNIGTAYMAVEQPAVAARYFAAARDARPPSQADNVELMIIESNMAMTTPDGVLRERIALDAWQRRRTLLGESHLMTLQAGDMYGRLIRDPARALPIMNGVCATYHARHPDLLAERVHCEAYRALLLEATGDAKAAKQAYEGAAAVGVMVADETTWLWTTLAWADARRLTGATDVATIVAPVVAWAATPDQSWRRLHGAHAQLSSALARHACGGRELPTATAVYRDVAGALPIAESEIRLAVAGQEGELECAGR